MNYAQIRPHDIANGVGVRTSLFVSGCNRNCKGCFNTDYKDFKFGKEWTKEVEDNFLEMVKSPQCDGVTILGGDPLDQLQDSDLLNLLKRVKGETGKSIWIYSGLTFEEIITHEKRRELISLCDVLVDGAFVEGLKDLNLRFRGSSNQRILDVQKSLSAGTPILTDGFN